MDSTPNTTIGVPVYKSPSPPQELTFADIEKDPSLVAKLVEESKTNPLKRAKLLELMSGRPIVPNMKAMQESIRKQNQPYYQENYALELIPLLDEMIATEDDYELPIADVNIGRKKALKASTLYNRVYQATSYIFDNLDPTGKYNELRKKIEIERSDKGVNLVFKEVLSGSLIWKKRALTLSVQEVLDYITEFSEKADEGQAFTIPSDDEKQELPLDLTEEEQQKVKSILEKFYVVGVIGVVGRNEVKLAKRKV